MAEEIAFENGWISNFEGSRPWPWIGSYCIPSCITRRPLPTYQISLKLKKVFVDGRTDVSVRMDGHLRPTLLGRLCWRVNLQIWILVLRTKINITGRMSLAYSWALWHSYPVKLRHLISYQNNFQMLTLTSVSRALPVRSHNVPLT